MADRSKNASADTATGHMSVHKHLLELRGHLFMVALVFVVFSVIGYAYQKEVLAVLLSPLDGQKLSYLTLAGGFSFIFKITMWCGIAAAVPVLLFALYRFISPALPANARSKSILVLPASLVLMICGALFGYFYAIPGAIRFLLEFADQYVNAMLTADSYLNFVLAYTIGLGILFQIPLLMMLINWAKPLRPMKLLAFERWVVLGAFIAAAFITPTPDAINQCVIALPIIAMYQIGLLSVVVVNWKKRRQAKKTIARTVTKNTVPSRVTVLRPTVPLTSNGALTASVPSVPKYKPRKSVDGLLLRQTATPHSSRQIRSTTTVRAIRNARELNVPIRAGHIRRSRSIDGIR